MTELLAIIQIVQSGADVALCIIAYAIFRIERRVFRIETLIKEKTQ